MIDSCELFIKRQVKNQKTQATHKTKNLKKQKSKKKILSSFSKNQTDDRHRKQSKKSRTKNVMRQKEYY